MVSESESALGDLPTRWSQIDDATYNRPVQSLRKPWPGAPWYHFPVMGPKIDIGTAFVAGPLARSDPYISVRAGGPDGHRSELIERCAQLHYSRALFPAQVRLALDIAQRRGNAVIRASYVPTGVWPNGRNRYPYLKLEACDPLHYKVYPAWVTDLSQAILHGPEYDETVEDIQEKIDSGEYYDVEIRGGMSGPDEGDERLAQNREDNAVIPEHERVKCAEFYTTIDFDGEGRHWTVRYALDEIKILSIKECKYRRSACHDFYLHREYNRWYRERSRGSALLGPQYFANDMRNLTVWLSMYTAMRPMFGENWSLPDEVIQAEPGMVYPIERGGQVFTPQGQVDLAAFPALIQMARDDADVAARLSANSQGVALPGTRRTAAEVNRIGLGQDVTVDEDAANAGFGLAELTDYVVGDLLYENFDDWYPWYGSFLPQGLTKEDFDRPYSYEVSGQTFNSSPEAILQQAALLTQSLAQMMQMDPTIMQRYPEIIPGLLRSVVDVTVLSQKDTMLPTKEEEIAQRQMMEAMIGQISGAVQGSMGPLLSGPMLGLPSGAMAG